MNPITSVTAWCDGVGHGPETVQLYLALVLEECAELLDAVALRDAADGAPEDTERLGLQLKRMSRRLRLGELRAGILPVATLDAALDTAWVALCLARALTGGRLPQAWAELHRSNIDAKQQGGVFLRDASGKVVKPAGWTAPAFEQFLLVMADSEGGEA